MVAVETLRVTLRADGEVEVPESLDGFEIVAATEDDDGDD